MSDDRHDTVGRDDPSDTFRRRSRVDAFMPLSSLQSLRPIEPMELPTGTGHREPVTLAEGCQIYHLPMRPRRERPY